MKKLIVIIVLLAYGLSATGTTVHIHFCCGKIDAVKLVPVTDDHCPAGHKEKKPGCCDDKQLDLKIESDHKYETPSKFRLDNPILIHSVFDQWQIASPEKIPLIYRNTSSPPGFSSIALYKMNCIYRI